MRNTLLAATFLIPIAAIGPAFAQDVGGDVGGDVDIDISASEVDAGVDTGADAGVDVDAGDAGVDVDADADVDVDAGAEAGAEGGGGDMEAITEVTIGAEAGGDVTLTTDDLMDATVYTNDDVALGTVVDVAVGEDGATLLVIARADGQGRVSVRIAQAQLTADGTIRIDYSEADMQAVTGVTIGAEAGGDVTLTTDELIDLTVYTNDGIELGTVVDVVVGDDGATVLIIARADGEGNIRIRVTNAEQTADGNIRVNYSDAEIQQRIAAETEARAGDDICFFTEADYQGESFCVGVGASFSQLTGNWNDSISSIQVAEGASVEVCLDAAYTGGCQTFNAAVATLPEGWNDMISSFRTR